jgi:hypothetical protein
VLAPQARVVEGDAMGDAFGELLAGIRLGVLRDLLPDGIVASLLGIGLLLRKVPGDFLGDALAALPGVGEH